MKNKEQILKEFDEEYLEKIDKYNPLKEDLIKLFTDQKQFLIKALTQTREETIREEIAYWIDVFDNRPKDRDLESDIIAQNFARIEIERLENKLKK